MPRHGEQSIYTYATRRGLRTRIAEPLALRARAKRRKLLLELMRPAPEDQIVDVGCGSTGLALLDVPGRLTGVDLEERTGYPGEEFIKADARDLPLPDGGFDIVYSNSLIEHLPPTDQERVAAEIQRVGDRMFVQTPNRWFPVEPHALLPFVHWLPKPLGRRLWKYGVTGETFDSISLLSARDMRRLFPGAEIVRERVGPLTKSLIAVRR